MYAIRSYYERSLTDRANANPGPALFGLLENLRKRLGLTDAGRVVSALPDGAL